MKKCECKICLRHEEFERQLNNLKEVVPFLFEPGGVEEAIEFFEKIYEDLNYSEMDNDVNNAILSGEWPTARQYAEQIIERLDRRG